MFSFFTIGACFTPPRPWSSSWVILTGFASLRYQAIKLSTPGCRVVICSVALHKTFHHCNYTLIGNYCFARGVAPHWLCVESIQMQICRFEWLSTCLLDTNCIKRCGEHHHIHKICIAWTYKNWSNMVDIDIGPEHHMVYCHIHLLYYQGLFPVKLCKSIISIAYGCDEASCHTVFHYIW